MAGVPLRVRAGGLDLLPVRGELRSWHQFTCGDWWGLVELTLTNRTGRGTLPLSQLVHADALQRIDADKH